MLDRKHSYRSVYGFSLLEIIVVTAVLVILMTFLYSQIESIRDKGNKTRCIANLRTISLGLASYLAEHGHYPGANVDGVPGAKYWYHVLEPYISGQEPDSNREVEEWIRCPSKPRTTGNNAVGYGYNYVGFGSVSEASGQWGEPGNGYMSKYWKLVPAKILNPESVIVIGDNRDVGGIARYIYNSYTATSYASRHNGGGHYLFADNHIEWLGSQEIADLSRKTNKAIFNPF